MTPDAPSPAPENDAPRSRRTTARSRKMADEIQAARILHDNALADADIRARLAEYGYDQARMEALNAAITRADARVSAQNISGGQRNTATQTVTQAERDARAMTARLAAMCRLKFSLPQQTQLGLGTGRAPAGRAAFLQYAATLYTAARTLPDLAAVLARSGYPAARLQTEQATITALSQADAAQEAKQGDASRPPTTRIRP